MDGVRLPFRFSLDFRRARWPQPANIVAQTILPPDLLLKPDAEDIEQAASSDEVALAGKGFNEEVEKKFKEGNSEVNYAAVDEMEKIVVSQQEMEQFLDTGAVFPEGGAK